MRTGLSVNVDADQQLEHAITDRVFGRRRDRVRFPQGVIPAGNPHRLAGRVLEARSAEIQTHDPCAGRRRENLADWQGDEHK